MRNAIRLLSVSLWACVKKLIPCAQLTGLLMLGLSALVAAENTRIHFVIPSQALDSALLLFAEQADMDLVGLSADLSEWVSPAIDARMTLAQVLDLLLRDTQLRYQIIQQRSVTINQIEAAEPAPKHSTLSAPLSVLEEVMVNATRRDTNLQKTPIAVTASSQFDLHRHQVNDLRDMTHMVPGLEMINSAPQAAILVQLRGVGTTNITEIADGPVAIHIDGVYSPRSQGASALLYDIDRVEVLRGPQGTLFGRNSASGS
ncbi:MAG: TonB-dependent receptor plug domain-containing protein, partial [Spongiibacteraceae bacterium]|nr:TonB-dependent receptor plug domain-containing protein [Spongiibacteraceae bacterium]